MKHGFTLVELVIYLGLFGLFIVVVGGLFASVVDVQLEAGTSSIVEQDGRYIVTRLLYDVRRASSIAVPVGEGEQSGQLQLVIGGTTYMYAVANGQLQLVFGGNTVRLNGFDTTVSGFTVTRLGNDGNGKDTVQINLSVTGQNQTKSITTTVGLR